MPGPATPTTAPQRPPCTCSRRRWPRPSHPRSASIASLPAGSRVRSEFRSTCPPRKTLPAPTPSRRPSVRLHASPPRPHGTQGHRRRSRSGCAFLRHRSALHHRPNSGRRRRPRPHVRSAPHSFMRCHPEERSDEGSAVAFPNPESAHLHWLQHTLNLSPAVSFLFHTVLCPPHHPLSSRGA